MGRAEAAAASVSDEGGFRGGALGLTKDVLVAAPGPAAGPGLSASLVGCSLPARGGTTVFLR